MSSKIKENEQDKDIPRIFIPYQEFQEENKTGLGFPNFIYKIYTKFNPEFE